MKLARMAIVFVIALSGSVEGAERCRPSALPPCRIELHGDSAPRVTGSCGDEAWKDHLAFELPERFADADSNGWHEVVLQLDLEPKRGCGCAVFRIFYEGEPVGHTVNIGDSPTNDGYGGDAWSTRFDAEILVSHIDLDVFGAERRDSPSEVRIFGLRGLQLADRVLELEVCDQSFKFSLDAVSGFFNTYSSHELIAIRPTGAKGASGADARIYAAFNRVIHRRAGRPSHDRFGSGVRRIEIALTP